MRITMTPDTCLQHMHIQVHYYHWNRTGYAVISKAHGYDQQLRTSVFCLAPLGGGHGQRQIIVATMGCIPVLIGVLKRTCTTLRYQCP